MKGRKVKPVLSKGVGTSGGRGHKKRVKEGEYDGSILYSYMKTEQCNLLKLF
jgi:hypothetical protein